MPVEPALTTADAVRSALAGLSDGPRAERTARYLRAVPGGYGQGDRFRGVAVPQIRAVVARTALDDELERLVAGPWHEERMAALLIAVGRVKRLNRLLDRAQARPGSGTQTPPTVRDALAGREALGRRYLGWAARGAQAPRRRPTPGGLGPPQRPRQPVPVHRLHRATRRRGHRSPRPEPWTPPCAGAAAEHRYHRNHTTTTPATA